ncbi:uncharacterized protein DC041_0000822 [Schistosoma bovis]|uniref:Uncharacterized protein n=1 Tax=Schistosoma bovis TaxID=6184 RepID=A0A430PWZ9_SCHBO|nr:uncharacterized protein DC041_0000822 [Schistosoma bovis]
MVKRLHLDHQYLHKKDNARDAIECICTTYTSEANNGAIYRRAFSDVVVDSFNGVTTSKEQSRNDAHIRYGQVSKIVNYTHFISYMKILFFNTV